MIVLQVCTGRMLISKKECWIYWFSSKKKSSFFSNLCYVSFKRRRRVTIDVLPVSTSSILSHFLLLFRLFCQTKSFLAQLLSSSYLSYFYHLFNQSIVFRSFRILVVVVVLFLIFMIFSLSLLSFTYISFWPY